MTLYSTILSSNNAGGKSLVEKWLKDQQFFMGSGKDVVIIDINDDLSITIREKTFYLSKDLVDGLNPHYNICISKLPPFGIREVSGFNKVDFINIVDRDSKLPTTFNDCKTINFAYCRISEKYINKIKENLKKNPSKWLTHTKVTLERTSLV